MMGVIAMVVVVVVFIYLMTDFAMGYMQIRREQEVHEKELEKELEKNFNKEPRND